MPKLASKYKCTGCMGCVDKCPKAAIGIKIGKDGHRYIQIDQDLCIECGLCEKACPIMKGPEYASNRFKGSISYAAWSNDDEIRRRGATAGIFGGIAKYILSGGGAVVGTVMEGLACNYRLIEREEDLSLLQGSKYTASNPAGIYKKVEKILRTGRKVLFCGLPCHVAACIQYLPEKLQTGLYTIDLVCGGVSSPRLLEIYAREKFDFKEVVSFRNKDYGWSPKGFKYNFKYTDKEGNLKEYEKGERNLVTDGFACELTDRYSCYKCKFTGIERKSDLTIGDLWGDERFPEQHKKGISLVVAHTERGNRLLEDAGVSLQTYDMVEALENNRKVFYGKSLKGYFPERRLFGMLSELLSYKYLLRIYGGDLKTKNVIWWPLALWRLISFRFNSLWIKNRSNQILKQL